MDSQPVCGFGMNGEGSGGGVGFEERRGGGKSARASISGMKKKKLRDLTRIVAAVLPRAHRRSRTPPTAACRHMVAGIKDPCSGKALKLDRGWGWEEKQRRRGRRRELL